jgi:hypothetical protein
MFPSHIKEFLDNKELSVNDTLKLMTTRELIKVGLRLKDSYIKSDNAIKRLHGKSLLEKITSELATRAKKNPLRVLFITLFTSKR